MDDQKPTVLLIFGTLSLGGCGGHPMRPKLNLKDKDKMSKSNEYIDNVKSNFTCIFLSVRTKLKNPLCPRTLCRHRSRQWTSSRSHKLCNDRKTSPAGIKHKMLLCLCVAQHTQLTAISFCRSLHKVPLSRTGSFSTVACSPR